MGKRYSKKKVLNLKDVFDKGYDITVLNWVYGMIYDLYNFGMLSNRFDYNEDTLLVELGGIIIWMENNLSKNDYKNLRAYFDYMPERHGSMQNLMVKGETEDYNNLFDRDKFMYYRSKRNMIVPFKYMNEIKGVQPLESVYNDHLFTFGGTEELMTSFRNLCKAYNAAESRYLSEHPEEKDNLYNHKRPDSFDGIIRIQEGKTLLRMLCWWDTYGRLTGKTTDLNYINVDRITNFDFAFSSTTRYLSDLESDEKPAIFRFLKRTSWKYDISSWKPINIRSANGMFRYNDHIPECIKDWDMSKVTDMSGMFKSATNIPDISGWNVGGVKIMFEMFESAKNIPDISKWDVGNVYDMRSMFKNVGYIPDISKWKTSDLRHADSMFESSVMTSDLSEWDVSNVVDFTRMFNKTSFKVDTDFTKWNMKKANSLSEMFSYSRGHLWVSEQDDDSCYEHGIFGMVKSSNMIEMDIAAWDVSNVTYMDRMFLGSDFSADLSKWNVANVGWAIDFDAECDYPHRNPNFNEGCRV